MKKLPKLQKLNSTGIAHWVVPLVIVVLIGAIGGYVYQRQSNAAVTAHTSGNIEYDQLTRVNNARKNAGKRVVRHINCLNDLAEKWSQNMATKQTLYHNPNLSSGATNAWSMAHYCGGGRSAGYGETVGTNPGFDANSSAAMFKAFMNSAAHKAIIMDNKYNRVGIGAYVDANGVSWVTHIYAACNSDCTATKWSNPVTYPNAIW